MWSNTLQFPGFIHASGRCEPSRGLHMTTSYGSTDGRHDIEIRRSVLDAAGQPMTLAARSFVCLWIVPTMLWTAVASSPRFFQSNTAGFAVLVFTKTTGFR